MLLSSTAESMYWTGRYFERARALARAIQGYERLSLDLPDTESLDLVPLLALVGREAPPGGESPPLGELLQALVLDAENPSSVRGALRRARENLRGGRTVTPPAVWGSVSALYARLGTLTVLDPAGVFSALEEVEGSASRVEGELASSMTRDAAYSFWRIGCQQEHADMLLRTFATLVPALAARDDRLFADVRWIGLLHCIGAYSMYRRRHQTRADVATVARFALTERRFPLSLLYATEAIESELDILPRPGAARAALAACVPDASSLADGSTDRLVAMTARWVAALETFGDVLRDTYFPAQPESAEALQSAPSVALPASHDPFEQLGREHAEVENVLRLLDELSTRAECGLGVARDDLFAIVGFFMDFGVLGHHEKEEAILMPALLRAGFAWQDGPLAAMRRDHRQEHYFLRVLTHLSRQRTEWSSEDRRQFASVAREFTQFLRAHMRFEQCEVFEPASRLFSPEAKASLLADFDRFEGATGNVKAARQRLDAVRRLQTLEPFAAFPVVRHAIAIPGAPTCAGSSSS